ncbi:hypothetical protein GCM10023115_47280 [Pontixanthobacter gangjinensis]|uniref:Fibronectin type-III domain-containing protein n=1 Tax=Christiangramia aestuarii TaxID=1028746 RepID=A0A7M3SX50_9FLAO|nr:hypothetical protein [Christiangramia aestuarii]MUP41181.1 hypothetical protein [Christiangramia aestuarii]
MKRYIYLSIIALQLLAGCDSDPAPNPNPQPEGDKPGEALLSLPENNKECEQGEISGNSATVDFSWEASADTEKYDLKVTNLDDNTFTTKTGLTTSETEVSLKRGHPYSWVIISRNSGSATTTSETWKFYLAGEGESNIAPFPAAAVYPEPGATVTPDNGKITLDWEEVQDPDGDAVTYTLYADDVDGLQEPASEWQNLTQTSMDISVNSNTVYYWRVVSSDGTSSASSSIYTFKTSE